MTQPSLGPDLTPINPTPIKNNSYKLYRFDQNFLYFIGHAKVECPIIIFYRTWKSLMSHNFFLCYTKKSYSPIIFLECHINLHCCPIIFFISMYHNFSKRLAYSHPQYYVRVLLKIGKYPDQATRTEIPGKKFPDKSTHTT